jgi:hypothetical protein
LRKIHIFLAGAVVLNAFSFFAQNAPSLGDVATPLRSEKTENTVAPSAVTTAKPQPTNDTAPQDTADAAALQAQKEIGEYGANVRELLNQEKFEEIDRLAATARSTKARFVGGGWKLYSLYGEICRVPNGDDATDADWTASFERLKRWTVQKPTSITPRVALAQT